MRSWGIVEPLTICVHQNAFKYAFCHLILPPPSKVHFHMRCMRFFHFQLKHFFFNFCRLPLIGGRLCPLRRQLKTELLKVISGIRHPCFAKLYHLAENICKHFRYLGRRWCYWNRHCCHCSWTYSWWYCCCIGSQELIIKW